MIPEGKVVIIEPGTNLKFASGVKLLVKGELQIHIFKTNELIHHLFIDNAYLLL